MWNVALFRGAAKRNSEKLDPSNFKKNNGDGHTLKVNKDRPLC
jgi:hypothetical protein